MSDVKKLMMQDIGYVVTITIGRCLGAVTGASRGPLSIFQGCESSESSGEDIDSLGGIVEFRTSDKLKWIVQQK